MQWFGTPRHLQQGGNIFSERGQGGGQGAGEGVGEQRQAPTQAEPPGTSGCDVVPMKSQHR